MVTQTWRHTNMMLLLDFATNYCSSLSRYNHLFMHVYWILWWCNQSIMLTACYNFWACYKIYLFKCEYGYVIISGICNWELKDHFTLEHMHVLIVAYIISWWKPSSNAHQYNIYIHTIFTWLNATATMFIKSAVFMMSDDNLTLHSLLFITAHFSFITAH